MKGLEGKMSFYDKLTKSDRELCETLSKIEQEDANRCSSCGGEDCACCEYYLDRQRWKEPEELFPYANRNTRIPDVESEEFAEWCEYNELDVCEDNYRDFVNDWMKDFRSDYMH